MIPAHQTLFYDPDVSPEKQRGNCLSAVVASLLELPIEQVPNFVQDDVDHEDTDEAHEWDWWHRTTRFIKEQGYELVILQPMGWTSDSPFRKPEPGEYYAVTGRSPRHPAIYHIVIYQDGEMVHDPHPDGTGLTEIVGDWHWSVRPALPT